MHRDEPRLMNYSFIIITFISLNSYLPTVKLHLGNSLSSLRDLSAHSNDQSGKIIIINSNIIHNYCLSEF